MEWSTVAHSVIALFCETTARASEVTSPSALTLITRVLLITGGLLAQRIGR